MDTSSQLGYLQARLQSRFGDRLTEADWRLLETTPDLASFLQGARATSLRRLISHLPGETDSHTAERSLRQDWRTHVDEIARWSPRPWQPAIRWCATLSDLAPLVHLRRGERVMSWMRQDLAVAPYAQVDVEARMSALADSPLAPVLTAVAAGRPPLHAWIDHWLGLLPAGFDISRRALRRLAEDVAETAVQAGRERAELPSGSAWRVALGRRFVTAFRRYARTPVAIFAFLGLSALDFDRLGAGLAVRAAFPDPARRPRWA